MASLLAAPATAEAASLEPGTERWPVKTGTDDDVATVQPLIVDSTVSELGALPRPAGLLPDTGDPPEFQRKRAAPVETTVWKVSARIMALKLEADGDYHLVLQDEAGSQMVAEIPLPEDAFISETSPFFENVSTARQAVDLQFKPAMDKLGFVPSGTADAKLVPAGAVRANLTAAAAPPRKVLLTTSTETPQDALTFSTRIDPTDATITGVGFFDRAHGATGAAPNVIELHPVLSITFP